MRNELFERTILLTVGGSRAYGIHVSESDVDVKGVGIGDRRNYLGYLNRWEQSEGDNIEIFRSLLTTDEFAAASNTKLEGVVYEIRKFITLAADCNPNILDVLFCRDQEIRVSTQLGMRLRENRDLFLSAKAKHTFSGYGISQLKRIKGHMAWLKNPPKSPPIRTDFEHKSTYDEACQHWKQYNEWKASRNPARAALEEKFGYDTKHAAHLVRLLRMCREILETGKVNVWRGPGGPNDAGEIREIRNGAWSYDRLLEWAAAEDAELEKLYAGGKYAVPKQPDRDAIDRLCVSLIEDALFQD